MPVAGLEGEHAATFDAADLLLHGRARTALRDATYLRRERNENMYRQSVIGQRDALEAQAVAAVVAADVVPAVQKMVDAA